VFTLTSHPHTLLSINESDEKEFDEKEDEKKKRIFSNWFHKEIGRELK